jgi:hypothetical protein
MTFVPCFLRHFSLSLVNGAFGQTAEILDFQNGTITWTNAHTG